MRIHSLERGSGPSTRWHVRTRLVTLIALLLTMPWLVSSCASTEDELDGRDTGATDVGSDGADSDSGSDAIDMVDRGDTGCTDECRPDERRCASGVEAVEVCTLDDEGCWVWSPLETCEDDEVCTGGECGRVCASDPGCSDAESLRCVSLTDYQECEERAPGCFRYGPEQSCPELMVCQAGEGCVCDDGCSELGQTRCLSDTQIQICERTASGCLAWSLPSTCPNGGTCSENTCQEVCLSDEGCTEADSRRCQSATHYVVCTEIESGCFQWSDPVRCPGVQTCLEGECEESCTSDCDDVGELSCWDAGSEQICETYQPGCLKWSEPVACIEHQACQVDEVGCDCDDACESGDASCVPETTPPLVEECTTDEAGCLFLDYRYCELDEACESGECVPTCISDPGCTSDGQVDCFSVNAEMTCQEVEPDCFQWGEPVACAAHQSCLTGSCQCDAAPEGCTATGAKVCQDPTHYTECQTDSEGCRFWGEPIECPPDETCSGGECSPDCTSDPGCTGAGATRCTEAGELQTCTEVEDGCFKWGAPTECGEAEVCDDAEGCVCRETCTVDDTLCNEAGQLLRCVAAGDCTKWQASDCPLGDSCVVDECIAVQSPEVSCGDATFNLVDRGYGGVFVAGEFNEWSETDLPMALEAGVWSATWSFDTPGGYEYKLIIDGLWQLDPLNPDTVGEGFFTNNRVVVEAVENCDTLTDTRCAPDGALEICAEVLGCASWQLDDPPCLEDDEYCSGGLCEELVSPVVENDSVTFTVRDYDYAGVVVAGDFTDGPWAVDIPLVSLEGRWSATVTQGDTPGLTEGLHEYKFRTADGTWFRDPVNPDTVDDGLGGLNSVLTFCPSECEAATLSCSENLLEEAECVLGANGCYEWSAAPCPTSPQEYCLFDACQSFPEVHGDGSVTFYLVADDESTAHVAADFTSPPWDTNQALEMSVSDGIWSVTSGPLSSGSHEYKFLVDRGLGSQSWMADPLNPNSSGEPNNNSVVVVP